eukprot:5595446-Lingulodinium_polyedra.AAC.1
MLPVAGRHATAGLPSLGRCLRLLGDIERLRRRLAAGLALQPLQWRKLEREGALRVQLAEAGRQQIGIVVAEVQEWPCANPLCDAANWGCRDRCRCCRVRRPDCLSWR